MAALQDPVLGLSYGWSSTDVYNTQMDQNWLLLGSAVQLAVKAIENDPPATPVNGDRYIVGETPTGDWVGHEGEIATYLTAVPGWFYLTPQVGWHADVDTSPAPAKQYRYAGAGVWELIVFTTSGESNTSSNTVAEAGALAKAKVGVDLPFKVIRPGTDEVTVVASADGNAVEIHVNGLAMLEVGTPALGVDLLDGPDLDGYYLLAGLLATSNDIALAKDLDGNVTMRVDGIRSLTTPADAAGVIQLLNDVSSNTRRIKAVKAGANVTITESGGVLTIASTGGGGGGIADPGEVIDLILTDGEDVLVDDEGSVMYLTEE